MSRSTAWLGLLASVSMLGLGPPALADTTVQSVVVGSCGAMNYPTGQSRAETQLAGGQKCVSATVSLGTFQPSSSGSQMTPLSVTTSDSSGTLPTGAQNIISNTDSTNTIYCNEVGVAATTSDQPIPPKSWFEFTPKAAVTTLHCIAVGGTVTANGLGGSGLATGSGGGGGGSGTSANVGATGSAVPSSANLFGGGAAGGTGNLTGATMKAASTASVATDTSLVVQEIAGSPLITAINSAIPAGTNLIGKVGIDQTTPGTTNAVVPGPLAASGVSTVSKLVANNTTSVALDASAGNLLSVRVFNNSTTIAYLKLYNASQGSTTCGSGTPVNRIMIPGNTGGAGAVFVLGGGYGVAYGTAITSCVTTGIADNDTTAPAASTYIIEADYK